MSEALGAQVYGEAQPRGLPRPRLLREHQRLLARDRQAHRRRGRARHARRGPRPRSRQMLSDTARPDAHAWPKVLLARETVEGEAVKALLDNEWDNYLEAHPEETAGKQTAPARSTRPQPQRPLLPPAPPSPPRLVTLRMMAPCLRRSPPPARMPTRTSHG